MAKRKQEAEVYKNIILKPHYETQEQEVYRLVNNIEYNTGRMDKTLLSINKQIKKKDIIGEWEYNNYNKCVLFTSKYRADLNNLIKNCPL